MCGRQAARADIILRVKAQDLALASRGCFPTAALDGEAGREAKVEAWQETVKAGDGGRQARSMSFEIICLCLSFCPAPPNPIVFFSIPRLNIDLLLFLCLPFSACLFA